MVDDAAPGMPWSGAAQRADKVLLATLAFSGLYHLALLPLVPMLVASQPLLLAMIRGSSTAIVTLGALARTGDGSIVVAVLAGLPATIMFAGPSGGRACAGASAGCRSCSARSPTQPSGSPG